MDDMKLFGSPGTGKTASGLAWLEACVEAGFDIYRAAFVSYTNAAVNEARGRLCKRFGLGEDDLPFCRTLHSLCYRALGISDRDWCADKHLREFGEQYSYDLEPTRKKADEDGLEEVQSRGGEDAALLAVWDFARQRCITHPLAAFRAFADYDPDATARLNMARFASFVTDYETWKLANGLMDYTDLLLRYVAEPFPLPVSVAVIDEAQDLSPLMWRAADGLFANAEARGTLGDVDQAIYSWSGAEPALMNSRQARDVVRLGQSYRLPRRVVETANAIIRQNSDRDDNDLTARDADGEALRARHMRDLPLDNGESWFLLARNWRLTEQFTEELLSAGIPYRIGGNHYSPWDERGPYRAAKALLALADGAASTLGDLWQIVRKTPSGNSKKAGVWTHGSKTQLETRCAEKPGEPVTWRDLLALGMTEEGFKRVMSRDLSIMGGKVSETDLRAYSTCLQRGNWGQPPERILVSSIHGVKGGEADNVAVLMGCTGAPARAMFRPERLAEERRVAYVGATRARNRLFGLLPRPGANVYPWELMGI